MAPPASGQRPAEGTPLIGKLDPNCSRMARPFLGCIDSRQLAVKVTLAIMFIAMSIKEGANASLSSSLAELEKAGYPGATTIMPGAGTPATLLGKICVMFAVHRIGPRPVFVVAALCSGVGLFLVLSAHFGTMVLGWCLTAFSNAFFWACATSLISQWVDGHEIGRAIMVLGASNDVGSLIYSAAFSALQAEFGASKSTSSTYFAAFCPFLLMGLLMVVGSGVYAVSLRSSATDAGFSPPSAPPSTFGATDRQVNRGARELPDKPAGPDGRDPVAAPTASSPHPLNELSVLSAVGVFAAHGRVWLCLVVNAAFMFTYTTVLFVPKFAVDVLGYPASVSTLLVTAVALGSLLSDVLGGLAIDTFSRPAVRRIGLVLALLGIVCYFSVATLLAQGALQPLRRLLALLILVIAVSSGFFWNILLGVFTIRFGGPVHSATLAACLDVVSFLLFIPYQFSTGSQVESRRYISFWCFGLSFYLLAMAAAQLLLHLDESLPALPQIPARASTATGGLR